MTKRKNSDLTPWQIEDNIYSTVTKREIIYFIPWQREDNLLVSFFNDQEKSYWSQSLTDKR